MTKRISAMKAREHLGDLLDRVHLRDDQFVIERHGKPVAALVPLWQLQSRAQAKQRAIAEIQRMHEQMKDADLEVLSKEIDRAQREVRRRKGPGRKTKA